jgi:hypothetical protein
MCLHGRESEPWALDYVVAAENKQGIEQSRQSPNESHVDGLMIFVGHTEYNHVNVNQLNKASRNNSNHILMRRQSF